VLATFPVGPNTAGAMATVSQAGTRLAIPHLQADFAAISSIIAEALRGFVRRIDRHG